jgi:arginyl-tRNA--protein-N-Asp/Glu arginylyltransferase
MKHQHSPVSGLFLREDMPCPYIADGRTASLEFVVPSGGLGLSFDSLLAAGYRRLGCALYRNICYVCRSCQPLRIETDSFAASRSQKRTLKKNRDVRVEVNTPCVTPEKGALYKQYVISKHSAETEGDCEDIARTLANLHYGYRGSIEMDYFLGDTLIGVGIVDAGAVSLSSVYFYYDTVHYRRRPGVFSILQEISLARSLGKKYYYLGFYLGETPKMSYKQSFRPNQVYRDGKWITFTAAS